MFFLQQDSVSQILSVVGPTFNADEVSTVLTRNAGDVETTINKLLDNQAAALSPCSYSYFESGPGPSGSCALPAACPSSPVCKTLEEILLEHTEKTLTSRVYDLEVDRSSLWHQCSMFYKRTMNSPECLRYRFGVEFVGEEGVDAGE